MEYTPKVIDLSPEDIQTEDFSGKPYTIYFRTDQKEYDIYISSEFLEQRFYDYLVTFLASLIKKDSLCLHLNSNGGILSTLMVLDRAFSECKANKRCIIEGECASAAAMLAASFDNLKVCPYITVMFHNITISGNGQHIIKLKDSIEMSQDLMRRYFQERCSNVLTEEEIDYIINNNQDYYLPGYEINKRVKDRMVKHTVEQMKKSVNEGL